MERGKFIGGALCLGSVSLTVLFLAGIAAGAYWAIAIPVAVLIVAAMTMLFWMGWVFLMTEPATRPEPPRRDRSRAQRR